MQNNNYEGLFSEYGLTYKILKKFAHQNIKTNNAKVIKNFDRLAIFLDKTIIINILHYLVVIVDCESAFWKA